MRSFFIGWESTGLQQFKSATPAQLTHAAGVTQKMNLMKTRSALTFEVQNLTNAKVFNFFGVQCLGSAFYVKLTTQF